MTNVVVFSKYNLLKLAPTIIPLMEQGGGTPFSMPPIYENGKSPYPSLLLKIDHIIHIANSSI